MSPFGRDYCLSHYLRDHEITPPKVLQVSRADDGVEGGRQKTGKERTGAGIKERGWGDREEEPITEVLLYDVS